MYTNFKILLNLNTVNLMAQIRFCWAPAGMMIMIIIIGHPNYAYMLKLDCVSMLILE